jgi:Type II CAAX prenyl endopeptidase Rce1-like
MRSYKLKQFLRDYFLPTYIHNKDLLPLSQRLYKSAWLWLAHMPILFISGAISSKALLMYTNSNSEGLLKDPVAFGLGAIIIAPVMEEVMFRGFFTTNKWGFLLAFGGLYAGISVLLPQTLMTSLLQLMIVISFLFYNQAIQKLILSNYLVVSYLSINIFALAHLSNYRNLNTLWYLIPIVVLPQYVGAMLFTYIRNKYGLIASIYTHALHNGMLFLGAIIFISLSSN